MSLREHIIEREKLLFLYSTRCSEVELRKLISTNFIEVGASGSYQEFTDIMVSLPLEENWSCKAQDWEFRLLSEDVAQLFYNAAIFHDDGDHVSSRRTSIWKKENNEWKMIFHQGTKILDS